MKMNKKNLLLSILLLLLFTMCIENHVLPNFGTVKITSDPAGADIYKNGELTNKKTPATFDELISGTYTFSIKLNSFIDTSFTIEVNEGTTYTEDIFLREKNPKGKITITSKPAGAKIFLNNKDTGKKTPAIFNNLSRGNYNFTLKLDFYEDHNININLARNEIVERNINLVLAGNAGSLFITSTPQGAKILLDNNETGSVTPDTLIPVSAGEHQVTLSLANYRDTTFTVNVTARSLTQKAVVLTVYEPRGSITINSNPQGAKILLNGSNTGLATPNTITKLEAGNYAIKLQLQDYYDTTLTATVLEDQNTNLGTINLIKIPVYKITATTNPSGAGTISGTGDFKQGEQVSLITNANAGYRFVNWTENGVIVSANSNYSFIATQNRNLVANYNIIGNLEITSDPVGADIYLNGNATNKKTPYTFNDILAGQYLVTLKLKDFADTTKTILVNRNQTTNVNIYLRDNTPPVTVILNYRKENNRLIFSFSFNQDVTLNQVNFTKPDGTTLSQNYGGQTVPKNRIIELRYPEIITGVWNFRFIGNKVGGRKKAFNVDKSITVN